MNTRALVKRLTRLSLLLALLLMVLFGGLIVLTHGGGAVAPGWDDLMGWDYWYDKNKIVPRN